MSRGESPGATAWRDDVDARALRRTPGRRGSAVRNEAAFWWRHRYGYHDDLPELADPFIDARERANVDSVALLAHDATLAMPRGRDGSTARDAVAASARRRSLPECDDEPS